MLDETQPSNSNFARGWRLYDENRYAEALPFLQMARADNPDDSELLHLLGYTYYALGDMERAIEAYQDAIRLDPDDAYLYGLLASAYCHLKDYEKAEVLYKKAIFLGGTRAWLFRELAYTELEKEDFTAACDHLRTAYEKEPDNPQTSLYLGYVLGKQKAWQEALTYYAQAAALSEQDTQALVGQGEILCYLGRYAEAEAAFAEALRRAPDDPEALRGRQDARIGRQPRLIRGLCTAFVTFKRLIRSVQDQIPFAEDEDFTAFTTTSLRRMVEWFGPASDPEWRLDIWEGPITGQSYQRSDHSYLILIEARYREGEQRYHILAHEMYHRVTCRRRTLRRRVWVDEMLAEMAALRLMREQGFCSYAEEITRRRREEPNPLPLRRLKRTRRSRRRLFTTNNAYPAGFGGAVTRVGQELEHLVGWEHLCRLAHCRTWQEWLEPLPADTRAAVCRLLEMRG